MYVMPIHTKSGSTVVTPASFSMKQRCLRLKRELLINRKQQVVAKYMG